MIIGCICKLKLNLIGNSVPIHLQVYLLLLLYLTLRSYLLFLQTCTSLGNLHSFPSRITSYFLYQSHTLPFYSSRPLPMNSNDVTRSLIGKSRMYYPSYYRGFLQGINSLDTYTMECVVLPCANDQSTEIISL